VAAIALLLLALPWIIYPAAMALLSRAGRRTHDAEPDAWPDVSVVVATRDDSTTVLERLRNLRDSDYPLDRLEVIISLDSVAAPENTQVLQAASLGAVVVHADRPGGKAAALNAGVRVARGEILVFADANQLFSPDAIRRLVRTLAVNPDIGAASGVLQLGDGSDPLARAYRRYEARLRHHEGLVHSSIGVVGAIYALRRSLWHDLPASLILDDVFVPMRVVLDGHRVVVEPGAVARERRVHDVDAEYARKVRTLTGIFQLCAWLPEVLSPRRNPVWPQFVLHKLARFLTPVAATTLLLASMFGVVQLASHGLHASLLAAVLAVVLLTAVWPRLRRLVSSTLRWSVQMQRAMVEAAFNGARGHWKVW
jgi:cellulose synthase/poly-beta-1,6-N-acetylglucosamine synthase-like glycosyltransferase